MTRPSRPGRSIGASTWLSAAIGLASGLGQWIVAVPAAIAGVAVLSGVRALESGLGIRGKRHYGDRPGDGGEAGDD